MLHRLRKYLALPAAERRMLLEAIVRLTVTDVLLRTQGFQRATRSVRSLDCCRPALWVDQVDLQRAQRYANAIDVAARHYLARAECLHHAITLHRWLRHERLPSELRLGVRKQDGTLQAHAWVDLGGQVVHDEPAAITSFTPLERRTRR